MGLRILMILREDFPPDMRVLQEAAHLIRSGHEVALVCFNRKGLPAEETIEDVRVMRLSPWPSVLKKAHTLFNNLPYINPAWYGFILRRARAFGADILHVHDLPLAKTALTAGARLGKPVLFDMHENWAGMLPSVPRRPIEKLLATRYTFNAVEVEACERAARVVVVVEESKARLEEMGVPSEKIIITPNVADLDRIPDSLLDAAPSGKEKSFIYAGGLSRHRGLDILIKAWARFAENQPGYELVIAGTGPEREALTELASSLGMEDSIAFPGWLDFDSYLRRISRCSVGLVPHVSTPHTDSTLPHKIFHYMALKKPVIVGDAAPLKRIVEKEGCGIVVKSGDVNDMADALAALSSDSAKKRAMGENGRRAVNRFYNWDRGMTDLLSYYDGLESELRSQR